jgi:DNA-binding Lrp family transcriptional regulator
MLDEKDECILAELKKNSRNSTKNIASNVKIPRIIWDLESDIL